MFGLLPWGLAEHELVDRVRVLVDVGAVVTAHRAGAPLFPALVASLVEGQSHETLLDALGGLLGLFAELDAELG